MSGIGRAEFEIGAWYVERIRLCMENHPFGVSLRAICLYCERGEKAEVDWPALYEVLCLLEGRQIVELDRDDGGNINWLRRGEKWPAAKGARRTTSMNQVVLMVVVRAGETEQALQADCIRPGWQGRVVPTRLISKSAWPAGNFFRLGG